MGLQTDLPLGDRGSAVRGQCPSSEEQGYPRSPGTVWLTCPGTLLMGG